jgi:hypothetical protein
MDRFLKISDKDRLASFVKAETDIGLSEDIIEKDFWVCWILKELFLMEEIKDHLTFKGGTSLSKIYKVISRFSEDIDVSVERANLGFKDETEPSNISGKKAKSLIADLGEACKEFVQKDLYHKLHKVLEEKIRISAWKLEIDYDDNDGQTLLFTYPNSRLKHQVILSPWLELKWVPDLITGQ